MNVSRLIPVPVLPSSAGEYWHVSRRERDVLLLLAEGFTMRDIAVLLALKEQTIRSYVKSLYAALGVHCKVQAIGALQSGRVLVREKDAMMGPFSPILRR